MKLNQFSNLAQPRIAVFKELHDKYNGVIVDGPQWITDPLDSAKELLRTVIQDDRGLYWAFMARTQMPDAIYDAVVAAGVDEIEVGGHLEIEWVETRGNTKVYAATYTPPEPIKGTFG